ncbi:hypothetical protein ACMFMF_003921 [Clarireedia jacksonii]
MKGWNGGRRTSFLERSSKLYTCHQLNPRLRTFANRPIHHVLPSRKAVSDWTSSPSGIPPQAAIPGLTGSRKGSMVTGFSYKFLSWDSQRVHDTVVARFGSQHSALKLQLFIVIHTSPTHHLKLASNSYNTCRHTRLELAR